jgi:hypothetical protein
MARFAWYARHVDQVGWKFHHRPLKTFALDVGA